MTTPSKELKRRARAVLEGNYFLSTTLACLLSLFSFAMTLLLQYTNFAGSPQPFYRAFYWILWAIMTLLNTLVEVGLVKFLYQLSLKEPAKQISILFYGFQNQPDTFILTFAYRYLITLIWFVPAVIAYTKIPADLELQQLLPALLPVLLLALAGVIPSFLLALPYSLSTYILLDDPYCSAQDALRRSRELTHGHKGRLCRLWISFLPLCLVGLGSFGMGFFWIRPYFHTTMAQFYLDIR
jgi:uncharacterized membrane protein